MVKSMLKIVSGSLDDLKAEMKEAQSLITKEIKSLEAPYRKDEYRMPVSLLERVRQMEFKKRVFYTFSNAQPVRVDGITINYRAVKDFEKKLKRTEYRVEKQDDKLVIYYNEKCSLGRVELYDISRNYEVFKFIPEAEII